MATEILECPAAVGHVAEDISDRVLTVEGISGDGDIAAAMGILSSGFRAKIFFRCGEFKELVVVVPPERLPRRAVRGLGAQSPHVVGSFFFWSVSSSSSAESSPAGNLLSASAPAKGSAPAS